MAIWWQAEKRLIDVNYTQGNITPRLFVVHIMQDTLDHVDSLFRNPASQRSSHFGVGRDGRVYQWVDTDDKAWHAVDANSKALGVEHAGFAGNPLTDSALEVTSQLYAWSYHKYPAISLWLNTNPVTGSGLSWHGLGGTSWGGHTGCPGQPIVDQLPKILNRAKAIVADKGW